MNNDDIVNIGFCLHNLPNNDINKPHNSVLFSLYYKYDYAKIVYEMSLSSKDNNDDYHRIRIKKETYFDEDFTKKTGKTYEAVELFIGIVYNIEDIKTILKCLRVKLK